MLWLLILAGASLAANNLATCEEDLLNESGKVIGCCDNLGTSGDAGADMSYCTKKKWPCKEKFIENLEGVKCEDEFREGLWKDACPISCAKQEPEPSADLKDCECIHVDSPVRGFSGLYGKLPLMKNGEPQWDASMYNATNGTKTLYYEPNFGGYWAFESSQRPGVYLISDTDDTEMPDQFDVWRVVQVNTVPTIESLVELTCTECPSKAPAEPPVDDDSSSNESSDDDSSSEEDVWRRKCATKTKEKFCTKFEECAWDGEMCGPAEEEEECDMAKGSFPCADVCANPGVKCYTEKMPGGEQCKCPDNEKDVCAKRKKKKRFCEKDDKCQWKKKACAAADDDSDDNVKCKKKKKKSACKKFNSCKWDKSVKKCTDK